MLTPPKNVYHASKNKEHIETGRHLLTRGQVGCVILAGGHGSRFSYPQPKGTFPITPIKKKSLFQLFSEKVRAAQNHYEAFLPTAFMFSNENEEECKTFFEKHDHFDLVPPPFSFTQSTLELLNEDKTPAGIHACDGNGSFFYNFYHTGLWEMWYDFDIKYVTVLQIDNPLSLPFDEEFIGLHHNQARDITLKAVKKNAPKEEVGTFVEKDQHLSVIEYSEIKEDLEEYPFANISYLCFSMDFIKKIALLGPDALPRHYATKKIPSLNKTLIKQEYFIFDALEHTDKSALFVDERAHCFAPLKNQNPSSPSSPQAVEKALQHSYKTLFEEYAQTSLPQDLLFELDPSFIYLNEEQKKSLYGTIPKANSFFEVR